MNGRKADGRRYKESGMLENGTYRSMRRGLETESLRPPRLPSTIRSASGLVRKVEPTKCNLFNSKHLRTRHGFTLLELLVVIAIISVLAAILNASIIGSQRKSQTGGMHE